MKFKFLNLPSPVFSAEGATQGGGDEGSQPQGGIDFVDDSNQGGESRQDRFGDKGTFSQFRTKEEPDEGGDKLTGEEHNKEQKETAARPDWLPEKFKTPADMAKAYSQLETKLRNGGKADPDDTVPEEGTAEAYFGKDFKLDDEVDRLGIETDDPGLKVAAEVFKKHGIGTKTAASIVREVFKGMNSHAPAPIDPEQEFKSLGNNGQAVIDANYSWLNKMDQEGRLSDEDANIAVGLMDTAAGVRFLNKMRSMAGERSIPLGSHVPASGGMSPEDWQSAYAAAIEKGDERERARLDSISAGVFGTGNSGRGRIILD